MSIEVDSIMSIEVDIVSIDVDIVSIDVDSIVSIQVYSIVGI